MERVYRDQSCTWWHADGKDESVDWRNFSFLSRFVANFVNVNKEFINFFCCSDFWIPVLHVCLDWMVACKTNVWFIESDEITDEGNEGLRFFINKRYITYSYKYTHNWFLLFHKKNSWMGKKIQCNSCTAAVSATELTGLTTSHPFLDYLTLREWWW